MDLGPTKKGKSYLLLLCYFTDIREFLKRLGAHYKKEVIEHQKFKSRMFFNQHLELNIIVSTLYAVVFIWGIVGNVSVLSFSMRIHHSN